MGGSDYEVDCPECGAALVVPGDRKSDRQACPVCGAAIVVAGGGPTADAEPEAAQRPYWEADDDLRPLGTLEPAGEGPMLVCCAQERKVNPLDVGPLVERFTGLVRRDALMQATRGMGILAEGLSLEAAKAVVEGLAERDIQAFVFPEAAEPSVARELKISRIYGADPEALHVQTDADGTVKIMPWEQLAAGICTQARRSGGPAVERHVERRPVAYGLGSVPMVRWRTVRTTGRRMEQPRVRVTLVLRDKSGRACLMPFNERRVRYAYLEQRAKANSTQNLGVFLGDVIRWGSPAFFPAGFRAAARGDTHRITRVVGKVAYENYLRWTICSAAAQGLFGAPQ